MKSFTLKEVKPVPSLIILNVEASKDNDPTKRHTRPTVSGILIRSVLPEEVPGLHNTEVILLGK